MKRKTTHTRARRAHKAIESTAELQRGMLQPYIQPYVDEALAGAFNSITRFVADHYPGVTLGSVVEIYHAAVGARLEQQRQSWAQQRGRAK